MNIISDGQLNDKSIEKLLVHSGNLLSKKNFDRIVAQGPAAVPTLINIIKDKNLLLENSRGKGWTPLHAVRLLQELKATEAIEPMIDLLIDADPEEIIYSDLIFALRSFGNNAVEPLLGAIKTTEDHEARLP